MDTPQTRLRTRIAVFALGVLTGLITFIGTDFSTLNAQGVPAGPKCGKVLVVDFAAKSIAGIALDREVAELRRRLGEARVKDAVEYLEGTPQTVYEVDLCGHRVRRHWNGVSWEESAFRTIEGIGIGSPLHDFDRQYGSGVVTTDEGYAVRYLVGETIVNVIVNSPCYSVSVEVLDVNRNCEARSLWFMFRP